MCEVTKVAFQNAQDRIADCRHAIVAATDAMHTAVCGEENFEGDVYDDLVGMEAVMDAADQLVAKTGRDWQVLSSGM